MNGLIFMCLAVSNSAPPLSLLSVVPHVQRNSTPGTKWFRAFFIIVKINFAKHRHRTQFTARLAVFAAFGIGQNKWCVFFAHYNLHNPAIRRARDLGESISRRAGGLYVPSYETNLCPARALLCAPPLFIRGKSKAHEAHEA